MKGTMSFVSEENKGTKFTFTVQLEIPILTQTPLPSSKTPEENINKVNFDCPIMLAEDNAMNQLVIVKLLKNMGFRDIVVANNGLEALELSKTKKFRIILMDCMMPVMSGIRKFQEISKKKTYVQKIVKIISKL